MNSTLLDVTANLASYDQEFTIYATKPWAGESNAIVARECDEGGLPAEATQIGASYFLEVFVAMEFLQGWCASLGRSVSQAAQCERLIQYATNDA